MPVDIDQIYLERLYTNAPVALLALKQGRLCAASLRAVSLFGYQSHAQFLETFVWDEHLLEPATLPTKEAATTAVAFKHFDGSTFIADVEKSETDSHVQWCLSNPRQASHGRPLSSRTAAVLLDSMPIGVYVIDAKGEPIYANPKAEELIGQQINLDANSADKIIETYQLFSFGTDTPYPTERTPVYQALTGKTVSIDDMEVHQPKTEHNPSKRVPLEVWAAPIYDDDGNIAFATAVFQDNSERKSAEMALKRSELRLRSLISQMPSIVFVIDKNGIFELSEGKGLASIDLEPGQVVGMSAFELYKDYPIIVEGLKNSLLGKDQAWITELNEICFDTRAIPLHNDVGEVTGVLGVATDVTEQTRNRRFLDSIIENLPDMVFIKDAKELRFVRLNQKALEMMGVERSEVLGKNDFEIFRRDQAEFFVQKDREVLNSRTLTDIPEEGLDSPSGHYLLHTKKIPILDEEGSPIYLLGISRDITQRHEDERRLAELHDRLLTATREAGRAEVATGAIHNIGNVLTSLRVSANVTYDLLRDLKLKSLPKSTRILRDEPEPDLERLARFLELYYERLQTKQRQISDEIERILKSTDHVKAIIDRYQDLVHSQGVIESVNLRDILDDALSIISPSMKRHKIQIALDVQSEPQVKVDRHKVLEILVNLMNNAKDAVCIEDPSTPHIAICLKTEGTFGHIKIQDNGVGIVPEHMSRIFEHGFTTKPTGHGFGLHNSALTARELGGQIGCESEGRGAGAFFWLKLPIEREET